MGVFFTEGLVPLQLHQTNESELTGSILEPAHVALEAAAAPNLRSVAILLTSEQLDDGRTPNVFDIERNIKPVPASASHTNTRPE